MYRSLISDFGLPIPSVTGSGSAGDTVTPGNNTYGAFAALLSSAEVTDDSYGIFVNINNNAVSGVARDTIVNIGVDQAGGTSYTVVIPDLLGSCAGNLSASSGGCGGISYFFPLRIKAGSSIAAQASVNNATVGTLLVYCVIFCKPTYPNLIRTGSFVRSFGINTGTSSGTVISPNTAGGKSAFIQVGSAMTEPLWWFCMGTGLNNANCNNTSFFQDLAIGSSTTVNNLVILNQNVMPGAVETMAYYSLGASRQSAIGDLCFIRSGTGATPPTGLSAAAYGMGG